MLKGTKWSTFKEIIGVTQTLTIIVGFFVGLFGLYYAARQVGLQSKALMDGNKIASANFILQISNKLDGPDYNDIITAIEDNNSNYSLLKKFTYGQVEDYIGNFETVGYLIRDKLVDPTMAYNELGYDVEKAWCNKDVQKIITQAREDDKLSSGPAAFYSGFEELAKFSLAKDSKNCKDMDNE